MYTLETGRDGLRTIYLVTNEDTGEVVERFNNSEDALDCLDRLVGAEEAAELGINVYDSIERHCPEWYT